MKRTTRIQPHFLLCLAVLSLLSLTANSQRIQSSCTAPDSIVKKYREDADQLAIRRIFRQDLRYTDSTAIPKSLSDTVLNAILAVYNLDSSKERDTVFDVYKIRSRELAATRFISFVADTNLSWIRSFKNGMRPVGQPTLDSILTQYNFNLRRYYPHPYSSDGSVNLELIDTNLNVLPIAKRLEKLDELDWVCVDYNRGDGDNIWDSVHVDHVELLFSIGRMDCPSGCIYRKHWRFRVYFDCSVEFVESFVGPNPRWVQNQRYDYQVPCFRNYTSVGESNDKNGIQLFPNPTIGQLTIDLGEIDKASIVVYDPNGAVVEEITGASQVQHIELKSASGLYFVVVNTDKGSANFKVLKR